MSTDLNNISYEEINQYLNQGMNRIDRLAFESRMKNDPFLKEAVDGYAGHAKIQVEHALGKLHRSAQQQGFLSLNKLVGIASAAAVSILVVAFTSFFFLKRAETNVMADAKVEQKAEPEAQKKSTQRTEAAKETAVVPEKTKVSTPSETKKEQANEVALDSKGKHLKGKVVDAEGKPLAGAELKFSKNKVATTSDVNGAFEIDLKDPEGEQVAIESVGYAEKEADLEANKDDYTFVLEKTSLDANDALADATTSPKSKPMFKAGVDGTQASKRSMTQDKSSAAPRSILVQPIGGFKKFNNYIRQNKVYPQEANNYGVSGEVVVQFDITPSGELNNYRILKSVGFGCDEEAIRLLINGPKWESNSTNKETRSYVFDFP